MYTDIYLVYLAIVTCCSLWLFDEHISRSCVLWIFQLWNK